jgi:hypothetical protein
LATSPGSTPPSVAKLRAGIFNSSPPRGTSLALKFTSGAAIDLGERRRRDPLR